MGLFSPFIKTIHGNIKIVTVWSQLMVSGESRIDFRTQCLIMRQIT